MFTPSRLAKSVRLGMLAGAVTTALVSPNLFAQEQDASEGEAVEKIEVTGSRIARADLSTPAPVITITQEEIRRFGTPDLGSILAELPAIAAGATLRGNNNSNANAGLSSPDLRSLGEERTLTLVNGKRHVAGTPFSNAVDTGTIPAALVERIEIITGGASAIYGSDAVSGVVNIILRDDFEGLEFQVAGNTDTEGVGADNYRYSLLSGATTEDGKGNVTFFAEVNRISEVIETQLQQADAWGTILNPDDTGEEDGIPDRLRVPFVGSEFINDTGVLNPFGGAPVTFLADGTPVAQVLRQGTNSFAFGNFDQRYDTVFFTDEPRNFSPDVKRLTLGSNFRYDINDNLRVYGDLKYVDTEANQQFQPGFNFGGIRINLDENPFVTDALRNVLTETGNPSTGVISMARFFGDIGNRSASNDRELFRFLGGVQGLFTLSETDFDYDVYFTRGETSNTRRTLNDIIPSNLTAALDAVIDPATGQAACRSQVPSAQGEGYEDPALVSPQNCAPFNPFGFNQASAEAQAFVSGTNVRTDEITQEVFGATLAFDTSEFLELPGGAIGVAVGYEWREETAATTTDGLSQNGFFNTAATPDSFGTFTVEEYFIEVSAPILKDVFLAHELSLDGAFRTADYSHAGSADAWQVGFGWAPIEGLRFRGQVGEAVRAPNVNEAFSPLSPGFSNINDPCDIDNIGDDVDRAANCAALGIPAGFEANDNVSIQTLSGGNPNLTSEEAETKTIGVVWTPTFIENFSLTLDYYNIEITDAIDLVSAQDILDNCVDATGGPDANFCSQVDRDPGTNDVTLVRSGFINAAAFETEGYEFQVRYNTDLSRFDLPGELRVNFSANQVIELNEFAFQDRPDEINVEDGETGDPEWQFRSVVDYRLDDFNFNWTSRFIDRSFTLDITPVQGDIPEDTDPAFVGSIWTHDLGVTYFMNENVQIDAGVRNIFNKLPPPFIVSGVNAALYDLVGRQANATITVRFE